MKVGDILRKKTARIATVRMNETVAIAAQLMRASNVSALVVKDVVRTEGNTAVGMFTERDVVRAIADHGAAAINMKISQLISVQQLVSCTSTDTLEDVRHLMNRHHIRHLPVIDNYSLMWRDQHPRYFNRIRRRSKGGCADRCLTSTFHSATITMAWKRIPSQRIARADIPPSVPREAS